MRDFITVCEEAARAGGAVLLEKMGHVEAREKGPADLVTQADVASQQAVCRTLLGAFPDHQVLGEEDDPRTARLAAGSPYRWLVDPLDGTTNYVHGVPHFSVSVALEHAGRLLAATVFDPVAGECFTATLGGGAHLNGRPIRTSGMADLSGALAAVGFPPKVRQDSPDVRIFLKALVRCQAIRRTGSAALNLCYVAAGRFDVLWSLSTQIWDIAAGVLLIREAGGAVASPEGGDVVLESGQILAAASVPLLGQLKELVAGIGPTGTHAAGQ